MNIRKIMKKLKEWIFCQQKRTTHSNTGTSVVSEKIPITPDDKEWLENLKNLHVTEQTMIPAAKSMADHFASIGNMYLDNKVDAFFDWYDDNFVNGECANVFMYHDPKRLEDFIDKMAVWFELRYPDYEINRLMPSAILDEKNVSEEMFINNSYIKTLLGESSEIKYLDWDEFYNTESFIKSLPKEDSIYLAEPRYRKRVCIVPGKGTPRLYLSPVGVVERSEGMSIFTLAKILDKELIGMHIEQVLELLQKNDIELPKNNVIKKAMRQYQKITDFKERLLDCVMYKIIERGGSKIGPRRGFIFAREFKRSIDIPMQYGVDYSDPDLNHFVSEYIEAGGSKDLVCFVNYFQNKRSYEKLDTITIREIISLAPNDNVTEKSSEVVDLYQRMHDVLASQIDLTKLTQAKRLQRKPQRSRRPVVPTK